LVIDSNLVRSLLRERIEQWADLDVRPVEPSGWDNRTFRLGDELVARLPSDGAYAPQVEKEYRWLFTATWARQSAREKRLARCGAAPGRCGRH
jgi:aminoglycoside phosphotransferase (APT) family kinase protein